LPKNDLLTELRVTNSAQKPADQLAGLLESPGETIAEDRLVPIAGD